ncbi:hypothetical protein KIPB_014124, partial [Kipferlia bialata]|eukprot:g14124.t1
MSSQHGMFAGDAQSGMYDAVEAMQRESAQLRSRLQSSEAELDRVKGELAKVQGEHSEAKQTIHTLETTVAGLQQDKRLLQTSLQASNMNHK